MSKSQHFQPVQFALLVHDATGEIFSGTISQRDLDGTRRLAESILKVMPRAVTVWIHPYVGDKYVPLCVEVVRRSEAVGPVESAAPESVIAVEILEEVPATPEEALQEVSMEVAAPDVPVEPSLEPIPIRRRGRPPKVKQEA